ncbi:hypothetical protein ACLOAU_00555 [Niabella sp. CJ426]|uniref:hypothetical protein n=1 Tax=Niabella sp. CJ426 TaxID=3393740 RepID=UPI003D012B38
MTTMRTLKAMVLTLIVSLWSVSYAYSQACYGAGGCQDFANFGFNSTTAATLEYDNYVSAFHQTVVRDLDGSLKIWGERTKSDGNGSWLVPTTINAGNYPGLTGTPLKVAIGSSGVTQPQFVLLTSDNKLWAWGKESFLVADALTSSTAFQQLSIGLPTGVTATDVKMFFGTHEALILTTCGGDVYVLAPGSAMRGAGGAGSATAWSHVEKQTGGFLTGIVAARGCEESAIALDASGNLWVWGESWNGISTSASLNRATPLVKPTGASGAIKMIGATYSAYTFLPSYYVLYTSGELYALGNNDYGQLGNWNTTNQNNWVRPTYTAGGTPMNDIKWISPNEHDRGYAAINVLTNSKVIYNWGSESGNMIGRGSNNSGPSIVNPGQPGNFQTGYSNTNVIAIESGGHTTMLLRECTNTFGYVGHRTEGSMGDNATSDSYDPVYHFNTNAIQVCGAQTVSASIQTSYNGPYNVGNNLQLSGTPSGGTFAIDPSSTASATLSGSNQLTFNTAGTLRINYTVTAGSCGSVTIQKVFAVVNPASTFTLPGNIWNDANGNAVTDGGEAGIANGLWANLVAPNGTVIASVQVNSNGTYSFRLAQGSLTATGNYSIVLTNSIKQVGDPLATADTPAGGYGYTGVNRGATGTDNTNRTGKLNIGDISGTTGGTTLNPANFGISNDPLVLPVQFANLSATVRGGVLFVNWTTSSEKNNRSFAIEASTDGVHFTAIGTADSKALNGNSDTALSYEFSADLSGVAMASSGFLVALLALGGLTMGLQRRRKLLFAGLMLAGISVGTIGCQKKGSEPLADGKNAYIRIAQIDQNGSKTYSKIVKVVNNN